MDKSTYATFSSIVFALACLLHLVRVVQGWAFQFGPWDVSTTVSIVAVVVTGYLAIAGWRMR